MARIGFLLGAMLLFAFVVGIKSCIKNADVVIRNIDTDIFANPKTFDHSGSVELPIVSETRASSPEISLTKSDFLSDIIDSKAFRDLSRTGYTQCAKQEWKQDAREKVAEYEWIENALISENPKEYITEGIYAEISKRLEMQLGNHVPVSVGVDLKEKKIIISLDTPCGFDRFSAFKVEAPPKYELKPLPLHEKQISVLKSRLIGKWVSDTTIDDSSTIRLRIVAVTTYDVDDRSDHIGHMKYVNTIDGSEVIAFDFRIEGFWALENNRLENTLISKSITNFKSIIKGYDIKNVEEKFPEGIKSISSISVLSNNELITKDIDSVDFERFIRVE